MPKKTIQNFSITQVSILNPDGDADSNLDPHIPPPFLKKMFKNMLKTRLFDLRATRMQRQGRIGTFASSRGQEAISIGSAAAMEIGDWAVPSFREQGVYLSRGIPAKILFLFYMGTEEGNRIPRDRHTLPFCVPCASQILHGVGIALAAKLSKDPLAVLAYFGDGATSEGDFHEALNFATVYELPVVFICQNNQWAISTPNERQFRSATLAQRALAYGMEGIQVDGNDVLGVYQTTQKALKKAKMGGGPTLIEGLTYRMDPHTTSDDPSRYRSEEKIGSWLTRDPLKRFEKYLLKADILHAEERNRMEALIETQLRKEAEAAEVLCKNLSPDEMFAYLYKKFPEAIIRQQNDTQYLAGEEEAVHA